MIKILLAAVIATWLFACTAKTVSSAPVSFVISDSLLTTIEMDTVARCPLIHAVTLTGKVSYNEENMARIFPMVSGNVSNINVQLGDYVLPGQTLAIINSSEMAGFASDLSVARANEASTRKSFEASQLMFKSGLIAEQD